MLPYHALMSGKNTGADRDEKTRLPARVTLQRASAFWRRTRVAVYAARRGLRQLLRRAGRQPSHLSRVLRRLGMRFKVRQQTLADKKADTEHS